MLNYALVIIDFEN